MAEAMTAAELEFADVATGLAAADAAASRQDTDEALRIWARLRADYPAEPAVFLRPGLLLTRLGRVDAADPLLADARARFPADAEVAMAHAGVAQARRDWPETGRRWADVLEQFPHVAPGYAGAAVVLRETGHQELSLSLLRQAIEQFPSEPAPLLAYADEAAARDDHPAEVARLADALGRVPQEPRIEERLARARARLQADEPAVAAAAPAFEPGASAEAGPAPDSAAPAEPPPGEPAPAAHTAAEPAPAPARPDAWEKLKSAPPPVPRSPPPPRRGLLARLFGRD